MTEGFVYFEITGGGAVGSNRLKEGLTTSKRIISTLCRTKYIRHFSCLFSDSDSRQQNIWLQKYQQLSQIPYYTSIFAMFLFKSAHAITAAAEPIKRNKAAPTRSFKVIAIIWHMTIAIMTAATIVTVTDCLPKPIHKATIPHTPASNE